MTNKKGVLSLEYHEGRKKKLALKYRLARRTEEVLKVIKVYKTVKKAVDNARKGNGPSLIEAQTYRWGGHHPNDPGAYKDKKEADYYKNEKDPVTNFKKKLLAENVVTDKDIDKFENEIKKIIDGSVKFAEESPEPDLDKFLHEAKQI